MSKMNKTVLRCVALRCVACEAEEASFVICSEQTAAHPQILLSLLHCLAQCVFAIIIICCVWMSGARADTCAENQYLDGAVCTVCPYGARAIPNADNVQDCYFEISFADDVSEWTNASFSSVFELIDKNTGERLPFDVDTKNYSDIDDNVAYRFINMETGWGTRKSALGMFRDNVGLTKIVLPNSWDGVTTVGYMFYGCKNLIHVTLPDNWGSINIAYVMFYGCEDLVNIVLPDSWGSITSLNYMFYNCSSLTEIILPDNWGEVENLYNLFYNCSSLIEILLPDNWGSVTTVYQMFYGCRGLEFLILPDSWGEITTVESMFYNCNNLRGIILPDSWAYITTVQNMFLYCGALTEIILPNDWGNVTTAYRMFFYCTGLTEIILPSSWGKITDVGYMFRNCTNLKNITLPDNWGNITVFTYMFAKAGFKGYGSGLTNVDDASIAVGAVKSPADTVFPAVAWRADINIVNKFLGPCNVGQYISGTECVDVGTGYYGAGGFGATRTMCPEGELTIGYGLGANESGDCGRILHVGDVLIYLRSVKKTTPALNVRIGDVIYYGNMGEEELGTMRVKYESAVWSVYDDSMVPAE